MVVARSLKNAMDSKRKSSLLVPYLIKDHGVFVYLQKRDKTAKRAPGMLGLFGGGIEEGETPESALIREIKEELNFLPKDFDFLGQYQSASAIKYVFIMEVDDDFESKIEVREGEYGKFFEDKEIPSNSMISENTKKILDDMFVFLKTNQLK